MRSTSMTNLSRLSDVPNKPVNIVYLQNNGSYTSNGHGEESSYHQAMTLPNNSSGHAYSASPPHLGRRQVSENHMRPELVYREQIEDFDTDDLAAQVAAIRLKLEEKRKRIEMEKGRMESIASKTQSKLGKAAYLKAINKVCRKDEFFNAKIVLICG